MRFIIFTTLFLVLFIAQNFAQVTKQPSKIASVTKGTEFVSDEGGFKINFPAKPARTVTSFDTGFGKAAYIKYGLATTLAYYSIGILDFPTVITDETELRARYDSIKFKLASLATVRIISETEIFYGDQLGREFVYEANNSTYSVRCFLIKQRLFEITVGTRGSLTSPSEKVNSYNKKLVDNFFNSFAVTKLPEPQTIAVELPPNFGVKVENGVFTSEFFKVTAQLGANWEIAEQEENDILKDIAQEKAKKDLPKSPNAVNLSLQNSRILLLMRKSSPDEEKHVASFGIVGEKVAFPNFLPSAMIRDFPKVFVSANETVLKSIPSEKINGVEYAWLEILNKENNYKKRFYITNRNGIAFEVFLIYEDQTELDALLKILQSIKFEETVTIK